MHADEYRKMANVEDTMWYYRALHRHVGRCLVRQVPAGARVLDAGCGTGGLLRHLQRLRPKWRLAGLDLAPLACGLARERTSAEIMEGSVTALPFADGAFDAMASCDVVCQVSEPARAVREFHRCLKPGGVLVLTMPAYQWMYSYHDREVGNLRRYSRREVGDLLHADGFAVVHSTYWNMLPFPFAILRRKVFPKTEPSSDVQGFAAPVEAGFNLLMALEHAWLGAGGGLPCGNSVLTVARKA